LFTFERLFKLRKPCSIKQNDSEESCRTPPTWDVPTYNVAQSTESVKTWSAVCAPVFLSSHLEKQQRYSLCKLDKEEFNLTLVLHHL
jgi:hypothetical protein